MERKMGAPSKLKNPKAGELRVTQLDRSLAPLHGLRSTAGAQSGWISEIRRALGLTDAQLAKRLGVVPSTVSAYQENERAGTITLNSLIKAGDVLDCDLVYALVPRTSLRETIDNRLREKALQRVRAVGVTMALEDQSIDNQTIKRQVNALIKDWRLDPPRDLWD